MTLFCAPSPIRGRDPCCREERGGGGRVAILCSDIFHNNVSVWHKDQSGRILSLLVKFDDFNLNLVDLYVPTIPAERNIFFQSVPSFFLPNSRLVIGGDMNCFDSAPGSAQTFQLRSRGFCVVKSLGAIFSHAFSQIMTLLF